MKTILIHAMGGFTGPGLGITRLALCLTLLVLTGGAQSATLNFEERPAGTWVSETYSLQGIHFVSDYRPNGGMSRGSPRIVASSRAPSPGNILLNYQNGCEEIGESSNVPLIFWFDQGQASVSMFLGTVPHYGEFCDCSTSPATVSFRDCNGILLNQVSTNITTNFNTFVQWADPQSRIQRVDVNYGNQECPEAIDNLSFTAGTGVCTDTTPPAITITSHTNDQLVIQARQYLYGYVREPGILRFLYIDGLQTPFSLDADGRYYFNNNYFDGGTVLEEGYNTVTFIAENASGLRTTAQLRLFLGTPTSATLSSFHLTQRGVMMDQACDVDTPLVAGKSTIVRVNMDVRTSSGQATYASSVRMNVYRQFLLGSGSLVGTFYGTTYSPYTSQFTSPSELAAIHFWIPGYSDIFRPGRYRFTFEAYVGSTQIGPDLSACGGAYYQFRETKPVRLLILPVERGSWDSVFHGTTYLRDFYQQLDTIARAYPVRDGIGNLLGQPRGVIFEELSPLRLCDGTEATANLDQCGGTGWTWDFIEKDPSGLLRRADYLVVRDPQNLGLCDPTDTIIGGSIIPDRTLTHSYNPALGVYRVAAIPNFGAGGKHATPLDEDHDGDVDGADLAYYAAEFFDTSSGTWTTDFNLYNQGETFRLFRDLNGNSCKDDGEPLSPVMVRSQNEKQLLFGFTQKAMDGVNQKIPGTASDFQFASLWFPGPLIPPSPFGATGLGRGNRAGRLSWIQAKAMVAMAHELGHNFDLPDLYGDSIPDDLHTIENAWVVYINGQSKPADSVFEIMGDPLLPDSEAFSKAHYQKIFDQLQVANLAAAQDPAASPQAVNDLFAISGIIYDDDGHLDKLVTGVTSGLELTPVVETSPYSVVFGQQNTTLRTVRFALDSRADSHGPGQDDALHYQTFHVVTAFPSNAEWVEIRNGNQSLTRVNRSASAPTVNILSPNGGESFGATQLVTIQWLVSDPDSSAIRSSVYYSPDSGTNWSLLAASFRGANFEWNTANAPATTNGFIRVVASDGFNVSEDQSDTRFSVARKPPRVVILEPRAGQTFLQCVRPIVRGVAVDLGTRINTTLWTVDGVTVSTVLEAQLQPLSPGAHTLRLSASDTDNQQAFDELTINILADSDCDGLSDAFENAYGLNPGSVNDAPADNDRDGLSNFEEAVYGTNPIDSDTDNDRYPDGMEISVTSNPLDPLNTPFTTGILTNALYIECGATEIVDGLGRLWRPDQPFLVTSNTYQNSSSGLVDTSVLGDQFVPQQMLLTGRSKTILSRFDGDLKYEIPVRRGYYSVLLYFSENCRPCVNPNLGGTGAAGTARIFDVDVEGLRSYPYNQADAAVPPVANGQGATFKATQLVFRDVLVDDGMLNIDLLDRGEGNPPENPEIKGMLILQQSNAAGIVPPHIVSVHRIATLLRIQMDPGPNRAAYYAGLTRFELQQSTDLRAWFNAGLPVGVEGALVVFETPVTGAMRFYRIATLPMNP